MSSNIPAAAPQAAGTSSLTAIGKRLRNAITRNGAVAPTYLPMVTDGLSDGGAPTFTIAALDEGFLLSVRTYNQTGPDKVRAAYCADAQAIADKVVAYTAYHRLNK